MSTLRGKIKNGQVVLDHPADLPDDTDVIITLSTAARDDDGPMSPDEIARVLAAMARVQPFEMTPEEEAELEAARRQRKEWEKAHFDQRAEKLRSAWE